MTNTIHSLNDTRLGLMLFAASTLALVACGGEDPPLDPPGGEGGQAEVGGGGSSADGGGRTIPTTGGGGTGPGTGGGGAGGEGGGVVSPPVYRVVPDAGLSWDDALGAAPEVLLNGAHGQLATAPTPEAVAALEAIGPDVTGALWLGGYQDTANGSYAEPAGGWVWIAGEPMALTNWHSGEPNDAGYQEDYLELWDSGMWADAQPTNPGYNAGYVVEYAPEDIEPVFNPATGSYYLAVEGSFVTWEEARALAQSLYHGDRRGDLVSITSQAEQDFIASEVGFGYYWLGGYQDTTAGDFSEPAGGWRWVSGEPVGFTSYAPGEPNEFNGVGEQWLSSNPDGSWNDNEELWDYFPSNDGFIVEFQ